MYTHQIFKRLRAKGHDVTLFSSSYPGSQQSEDIDGLRVVREGGRFSVYLRARSYYMDHRDEFDVVVDEINTVPFNTPRFVDDSVRLVALIHQLAKEFWYYEMPYPVAWLGDHYFETHWLKRYRNIPTITVSESTRNDLAALGFNKVHIVKNGLNVPSSSTVPEKSAAPSICFVGRMKKAKRPMDVVEAYRLVKQRQADASLTMIGDGYYRERLQKENPDVTFLGYVDRAVRDEHVKRSWVLAVPGVREGWGQVVTDSNALGTPAVGYDVPGLRDSIKDGYNGIKTRPDPSSMAEGLISVLTDQGLREAMSANAIQWSSQFSWDRSADEFEKVLLGH